MAEEASSCGPSHRRGKRARRYKGGFGLPCLQTYPVKPVNPMALLLLGVSNGAKREEMGN